MNYKKSIAFFLFATILSIVFGQSQPVDVTVITKTISGKESVKVQITDSAGNGVPSKVHLIKAYPSNSEGTIIASNKDLSPVNTDKSIHQFDIIGAKTEAGSYTLELKVTPTDSKKFSPVENAAVNVKVVGPVTISDTQVTISDSEDTQDISSGKKFKVEFGKKISDSMKATLSQHLWVEFKVKGASGNLVKVHQAFVRISAPNGRELIKPATYNVKGYTAHVTARDVATEFYGQSGTYEIQLIVGDSFISNPSAWTLGSVSFTFPNTSKVEVPANPFAPQQEIKHIFRQPDIRPTKSISLAFTAATIGIPALVLLVGLGSVGANLKNFPSGGNFIFAVGFQGCLGAILALFGLYWLQLNMVQTLGYLAVLAIPTLFFAHRNLNGLSKVKQHAE